MDFWLYFGKGQCDHVWVPKIHHSSTNHILGLRPLQVCPSEFAGEVYRSRGGGGYPSQTLIRGLSLACPYSRHRPEALLGGPRSRVQTLHDCPLQRTSRDVLECFGRTSLRLGSMEGAQISHGLSDTKREACGPPHPKKKKN